MNFLLKKIKILKDINTKKLYFLNLFFFVLLWVSITNNIKFLIEEPKDNDKKIFLTPFYLINFTYKETNKSLENIMGFVLVIIEFLLFITYFYSILNKNIFNPILCIIIGYKFFDLLLYFMLFFGIYNLKWYIEDYGEIKEKNYDLKICIIYNSLNLIFLNYYKNTLMTILILYGILKIYYIYILIKHFKKNKILIQ